MNPSQQAIIIISKIIQLFVKPLEGLGKKSLYSNNINTISGHRKTYKKLTFRRYS